MTSTDRTRVLSVGTVAPVWILTILGAVIIGVASPAGTSFTWLAIALAAAVLLTFAVQLSTLTREGFVNRVMASLGGAVLILAIATGVLALIDQLNG